MAAIFQIRRGSGSVSLTDGELYLHKASGSVQFSLGDGNPILLARLDQINSGSLNLSGDVTASNAYFSGDVAISGNLFLGNAANEDTITAGGEFTSNLIPNPTNTYSIGSTSKVWKEMHATSFSGSFSGSINGINEGVSAFSESVDSRLDQLQLASASLQSFTSSQETKNTVIESYTASMNTFTSSQEAKDIIISDYTASMNVFTASIYQHSQSINLFTSSQEAKDVTIGEYTASMNSFTSSTNVRLNEIELYTSSLKSAIDVTGGNTRILGNLIVDGTQTSINTTETFIEDKSITLASGSLVSIDADGAGLNIAGANVSMSWEDSNQRLYFNTTIAALGSISSSTVVGLNGDSVTVYSTSVDSRLLNLQLTSASLNTKNDTLEIYTASLNNKHNTLELYTASLELYTASVNSDLASIHQTTSSLNQFTASIAGINEFTASTKIRLDNLENTSASISSSVGQLNSVTASLHSYTSSTNIRLDNIELTTSSLNSSIIQINSVTASLNSWTGSGFFNAYSTSVDNLLDGLRYDLDLLTPAGLDAAFDNLNSFTSSANSRLNNIEATTSSINTKFTTLENLTGSYETNGRGIVSGSSQITPLLPTGVISGSSQIALILPAGTVSGSSQVDITATTNYTTFSSSIANDITSLNLYTSSLKGAITISGTDVSIAGGLTVLGTTTIIDSTTLNIKDNIIQLNGAGAANAGIVVRDATGTTTSGSLLWDTTNDRWIAGPLGSEAKVLTDGMGVISGSGQLGNYETTGRGIVSGSSQITFSGISSLPTLVSGSSQIAFSGITGTVSNSQLANSSISGVSLGSNLATLTIGTGLSGTSYNGSSLVTIANAGVTSNVAGTGITVSGATGAVTISIGQEVATTSNVQFGSLGIGTAASGVSGEIRATGDITAFYSSDIRLKENIQPIQNALEKVESISGNTYDWKEGYEELHSHKGNDVGVIAQEIEEILPQIVTNRDNGFKAVQYEKIIPLLIEAIKELSDKVKVLENK
jgi:hypothetical protein